MKKQLFVTALLLLLSVLLLAGCAAGDTGTGTTLPETGSTDGNTESTTTVTNVTVVALLETVSVDVSELETYDYTKLFQITVNGDSIPVDPAYIEIRRNGDNDGMLLVICSYDGRQATVTVHVTHPTYEYSVVCSATEVTVKQSEVAEYDFLSLFTVTLNGEAVEVTEEMITSDVCDTPGEYTYTIRYGDASATLAVHVAPDHLIEAIPSYRELSLTLSEYEKFDLKNLFSLYVDGVAVPVTDEMLDTSLVTDVKEGGEYRVVLRYSVGKNSCEVSATFRIVAEAKPLFTAKNVVTYPGAQALDLTTLFTITKNGVDIPVVKSMIRGEVDYKTEGIYEITLTYEGETVTATVEIRSGVVIQYATSDLIKVQKGTNPLTYAFDRDFVIMINGIRFADIPLSMFDLSGVDFDTPGIYPVTLTVKYNDKKLSGLSGNFTFTEYKATIRYQVVKNTYSVSLGSKDLLLPRGTNKYNVYQNLTVIINGRRQTLVENPGYVDSISCYAKTLSDPIDFGSAAPQTVRIAVYPDGPDGDAVIVEYTVRIDAGVEIKAEGTAIFAGCNLHLLDLFSITVDGKKIPVTNDMLSGKVDVFHPGVYTVSIEYLGMTASAQVVVFDDSLAGTYRTGLISIDTMPDLETDTEEDTWGSDDGEEGGGYAAYAAVQPTRLSDMVISEDGSILVGGDAATIVSGIDEHTMTIRLRNNLYTVYIRNGIAVLLPDNQLRMQYTEQKRPLIYFNEAQWKITDSVTVNSTSTHVLQNSITAYSYDIFCINSIDNLQKLWYTLKINLVEKTSSDTYYTVSWGEVTFAEDFQKKAGTTSSLTFDGQKVTFTMLTNSVGKVYRANDSQKQFANLILTGTVDGKPAILSTNKYEHFTLTVDGKIVFTANSSLSQLANGGVNYETGEVFLYDFSGKEQNPYSYKFIIDKAAGTFTYVPRDSLFGKYLSDSMFLFLDGYGTGVISFDTGSYYTTQLSYTEENGEVVVRYRNTSPSFTHGDGAEFFVAPLLNVLSVKRADDALLSGKEFVNSVITDGAVIRFSSLQLGAGEGRNELLSRISILTKDGELTGSAKSDCVSTSAVKFTVAGYYQFTVTVTVGGEKVTRYCAVQILGADYDGSRLLGNYTGIATGSNYFSVNRFGQVSLSVGEKVFQGLVTEMTEDTLYARVYDSNRSAITVRATAKADGVVEIQGTGASGFHDLYTTGTVRSAGLTTKETVTILRAVTIGNETVFYLSSSVSVTGNPVSVVLLTGSGVTQNGAVLRLTREDGTGLCLKVAAWGNLTDGIAFADSVLGTYTAEGKSDLVLDGFGNAAIDGVQVAYTLTDGLIFVAVGNDIRAFRVDAATMTYTELTYAHGNAMLAGKAFSASYTFICSGYSYSADTRFVFGANGKVAVYSVSPDHDSECGEDVYLPVFASKSGVSGIYSVSGDRVTVSVGGVTFVFRIPNVVTGTRITLESATLSSGEHGYFRPGEVFYSED